MLIIGFLSIMYIILFITTSVYSKINNIVNINMKINLFTNIKIKQLKRVRHTSKSARGIQTLMNMDLKT